MHRVLTTAAVFLAALTIAAFGAEVNLKTFFTYIGNFVSYFDRILKLDDGTRVWTNFGEWFWGLLLLVMAAVSGYLIFWHLSRRGWETLSGKEPVAQKSVARL